MRSTIDAIRFQPRPKTVGGPIDVIVIKPNRSFWVQRKELHGTSIARQKWGYRTPFPHDATDFVGRLLSSSSEPSDEKVVTGMPDALVYRLKVTLRNIRPPIWRRIEVPRDISLYQLHRILQIVMGWTDSHLHQFQRGRTTYGTSDPEFGIQSVNERRTLLGEVLRKPKDRMVYEYDFGDSWEHDVVLEAIGEADPGVDYPTVLAGARACPPEDVGGFPGYYGFLEAVHDPRHPEHEEVLGWHDGPFDPEAFDLEAVNRHFRRSGRSKKQHI